MTETRLSKCDREREQLRERERGRTEPETTERRVAGRTMTFRAVELEDRHE